MNDVYARQFFATTIDQYTSMCKQMLQQGCRTPEDVRAGLFVCMPLLCVDELFLRLFRYCFQFAAAELTIENYDACAVLGPFIRR